MTTFIKDAVCGSHSMRKAFAVVSAEIREKLVAALSHEVAEETLVVFVGGMAFAVWHQTIIERPGEIIECKKDILLDPEWLRLVKETWSEPEQSKLPVALCSTPICKVDRVWLEPDTEDDWEIMELNQVKLQSSLLDQMMIVQQEAKAVIYVGGVKAVVRVVQLEPSGDVGRLEAMTEVLIRPKMREEEEPVLPHEAGGQTDQVLLRDGLSRLVNLPLPHEDFIVRLAPLPDLLDLDPFTAVLDSDISLDTGSTFVTRIKTSDVGRVVKCRIRDDKVVNRIPVSSDMPPPTLTLHLPPAMMKAMAVSLGSKAELGSVSKAETTAWKLRKVIMLRQEGEEALRRMLPPIIIPNSIVVRTATFSIYNASNNEPVVAWSADALELVHQETSEVEEMGDEDISPGILLDATESCFELVLRGICDPRTSANVLLAGKRGSGKSTALASIAKRLAADPNHVYPRIVNCKRMVGKRSEFVYKELREHFSECFRRRPSVLILEDLDALCKAPDGGESNPSEDLYMTTVAADIIEVLGLASNCAVPIVASVTTVDSLHADLVPGRGKKKGFDAIVSLKLPSAELRRRILTHHIGVDHSRLTALLSEGNSSNTDRLTEGFTPEDLKRVSNKIISMKDGILLNPDSIESVLSSHRPLSLWNAKLEDKNAAGAGARGGPAKTWADVGGLDGVRRNLEETILWPAKYPELLSQCPLRARSGLLLYGPPGTGKTLVANVAAAECKVNCITVKGPELLSKYIGSSEASVRETFARAASAAPCILFFDEFDSLAPRRGHDSTGVTDRVVNQLLTQLDGVEGLGSGIFVVAATSRPDLIDPALLRPGRIDKKLFCPIPDLEDRLSILKCLMRSVKFDLDGGEPVRDATLVEMAAATDGFTGADLQAVVYTAQLNAVKEVIAAGPERNVSGSSIEDSGPRGTFAYCSSSSLWRQIHSGSRSVEEEIKENMKSTRRRRRQSPPPAAAVATSAVGVGRALLLEAVSSTRPSVSGDERAKYELLYERFRRRGGGRRESSSASSSKFKREDDFGGGRSKIVSARATLA